MPYWLMKSEPDQFGISDLERVKVEPWTGVRSFFARAHMRAMAVGDAVLFHHSGAKPPGVAGLARVVRTGVVDQTQFDPDSKYYEPRATREAPIWDCVEVEYVATLSHFVAMDRIRAEPELADMLLLRRGMRLSVQPVTQGQYERIVALGQVAPPEPPPPARPARSAPTDKARASRKARSSSQSGSSSQAPSSRKPGSSRKAVSSRKPRSSRKPGSSRNAGSSRKPGSSAKPRGSRKTRASRPAK